MTDASDTMTASEAEAGRRLRGLEAVSAAARELAENVRRSSVALGTVVEEQLAVAVDIAEDIRDRAVTEELLRDAREVPVLKGLRVTSHRVVDLGFDAVGIGVRLGTDAVEQFLSPRSEKALARVQAG